MYIKSLNNPRFKNFIMNENNLFFLGKILFFQNIIFPLKLFLLFNTHLNLCILFYEVYWKRSFILMFYTWIIFKIEIQFLNLPLYYFKKVNLHTLKFSIIRLLFLRYEIRHNLVRFYYKFYPSFFLTEHREFTHEHFFLTTKYSMYKKVFFNEIFLEAYFFKKKYNFYQKFLNLHNSFIEYEKLLPFVQIKGIQFLIIFFIKFINLMKKIIRNCIPLIGKISLDFSKLSNLKLLGPLLVLRALIKSNLVNLQYLISKKSGLRILRKRNFMLLEVEINKRVLKNINVLSITKYCFNYYKIHNLDFRRFRKLRKQIFIRKFISLIINFLTIIYIYFKRPFIYFILVFVIIFITTVFNFLIKCSYFSYKEQVSFLTYVCFQLLKGIYFSLECLIVFVDFNFFLLAEFFKLIELICYYIF